MEEKERGFGSSSSSTLRGRRLPFLGLVCSFFSVSSSSSSSSSSAAPLGPFASVIRRGGGGGGGAGRRKERKKGAPRRPLWMGGCVGAAQRLGVIIMICSLPNMCVHLCDGDIMGRHTTMQMCTTTTTCVCLTE